MLVINLLTAFFNAGTISSLLIILVLLIISGMISGAEIAFFSISSGRAEEFRRNGNHRQQRLSGIIEKPQRLLATILISNNFVNIAIVVLSTFVVNKMISYDQYRIAGLLLQFVVVTSLILLFGEIVPKIYAGRNPEKFALNTFPLISALIFLFYPFSAMLMKSTWLFERRISKKPADLSINDLTAAIEMTAGKDAPQQEKRILKGIAKFSDIEASEIMIPRIDVTAVEKNVSLNELRSIVINSGFSRIPVYDGSFDSIAGVLYIKDLLPYIDKEDYEWNSLLRTAMFVPENKKINVLLKEFQSRKIHMAVVVDEYGGTSGIITMEDILEEIVGEINDEYDDQEEQLYTKLDKNNYLFEAKISLQDFYKITGCKEELFEPLKGESESLAGLILEVAGKIPLKNEVFRLGHLVFRIENADSRRIRQVKVTIQQDADDA
jgi:putative hemolysin